MSTMMSQDLRLAVERVRLTTLVFNDKNAGVVARTNMPHAKELIEAAQHLAEIADAELRQPDEELKR